MRKYVKLLIVIVVALLFTISCDHILSTYVRFQNNSATKTVKPIWDGASAATLAPGQLTDYQEINPGMHTIKWVNAANNHDLTTTAWPNAVEGEYYTFPYND
jgi:hypothetical protein